MFNKVTIKGAKQAVKMFGPSTWSCKSSYGLCAEGTIPADETDDLFISVGVLFIG